eukprot:15431624-Alexandrium_andersonii.AAC.1
MVGAHHDQSFDRCRREHSVQQGEAALGQLGIAAADMDDRGQPDVFVARMPHRGDVSKQGGH